MQDAKGTHPLVGIILIVEFLSAKAGRTTFKVFLATWENVQRAIHWKELIMMGIMNLEIVNGLLDLSKREIHEQKDMCGIQETKYGRPELLGIIKHII